MFPDVEDIKRALRLLAPGISNVGSLMDKDGIFSLLLHKFTTRMDESIQKAETSTAAIFGRTDQIMNDLANVRRSCSDTMNVDANDATTKTLTSRLDLIESSIAEIKRSIYQRQPDQRARTSQLPSPFQPPEPNMKTRPTIPAPHAATANLPPTPAHQKKPADTMSIIEIQQELGSGTTGKNRTKTLTSQLTKLMTMAPKEIAEFASRKTDGRPTDLSPNLPFDQANWDTMDVTTDQFEDLNSPPKTARIAPPAVPPQGQAEQSWAQVTRNGSHSKNPSPPKNTTLLPQAQSPPPQKRRRVDDSQMWIMRFTSGAPPLDKRLTDQKMWSLVNSINKENIPFEAKSVAWSRGGVGPSIMIRFSAFDKFDDIDAHSREIRRRLAHDNPIESITLTKNVKCSKIAIENIPCQSEDNMDEVIPIEDVTAELRKNPLYCRLNMVQPPRWVTQDLHERTHGTINFTFEDPDGSYADDFCTRYIFIFGKQCIARAWLDRVDVRQCDRCWRFGTSHSSCKKICRLCGANDHEEESHCLSCRGCVSEGITDLVRCTHLSCARCKRPHAADDSSCGARAIYINKVRTQNQLQINAQVYPTTHNQNILRRAVGGTLR